MKVKCWKKSVKYRFFSKNSHSSIHSIKHVWTFSVGRKLERIGKKIKLEVGVDFQRFEVVELDFEIGFWNLNP